MLAIAGSLTTVRTRRLLCMAPLCRLWSYGFIKTTLNNNLLEDDYTWEKELFENSEYPASFDDYVNFDIIAVCYSTLTDDDILEEVASQSDESDNEADGADIDSILTNLQAKTEIQRLTCFFYTLNPLNQV